MTPRVVFERGDLTRVRLATHESAPSNGDGRDKYATDRIG